MTRFHFYSLLLFSTILQVAFFPEWVLLNVHFEILFAITVFIGIKYDWYSGIKSGILFGFAQDIFSIGPFGLSILTYGIAGFLASVFEIVIFTNHLSTRLFILFLLSLLTSITTLFIENLIQGHLHFFGPSDFLELNILSVCFVNTLFAFPLYLLLEKIPSRYGHSP